MIISLKLHEAIIPSPKCSRIQVRIGDTDHAIPSDDGDVKILDVLNAQIHPNFINSQVYFDVAVITTEPVAFQQGK